MKIKNILIGVLMCVASTGVAFADGGSTTVSGSGSAGLWTTQTHFTGKFSSGASSSTSGGSEATTGVNGNGFSFQKSWNVGSGFASAGGKVTSGGVDTWTNGGSASTGGSFGIDGGHLTGYDNNTAGGVATNYSSNASGSMKSFTSGDNWEIGGFFTGTFSEKSKHQHHNGF